MLACSLCRSIGAAQASVEVNGNLVEERESVVPTEDAISTESIISAPSKTSLDNFSTDNELTAAVPDLSDDRSSPGSSSQNPPKSDENISSSVMDAVPRPSSTSTPPATVVQTPTKKPPRLNAQAVEFSEKRLNLASKSSGATVLEQSAEFEYVDHILNSEKNEYGIVPCITRINNKTKMKNGGVTETEVLLLTSKVNPTHHHPQCVEEEE